MSTGPELGADLVAVACVVEASLVLAAEWSRVLIDYVYPLLKRLNELHPSYQFRLAFVTYGAADTRPIPLLCKKFFSPLSQVTKEIREEPSKLGIGQTNSGSGRGLCALEGYVAAIELFDILMASANYSPSHAQTQSSQKDNRSLISHILHIAASPPDNAQRPQWNTLQHLDSLNWDSIPAELRKRKINLSLISLRKIPQFQDVQSSVAGSGVQTPWFNVRAPHMLSLAGFPTPQKTGTKRHTDAPLSDQSPDTKRQKVVADPVSKTSSASPALPPARIPQNQRSQQPGSSQTTQPPPVTITSQNPSSTQPVQTTATVPASTPATSTPSAPPPLSTPAIPVINAEILGQVVAPTPFTFGQMMERLKMLEREVVATDSQISNAQNTGKTDIVAGLQKELLSKTRAKEQIKMLLKQHYQKILLAKDASNAQVAAAGSAPPNGTAGGGPSTQSQPPNAPSASSERPTSSTTEEHKPVISDAQVLTQFWHRGGAMSAPSGNNLQAVSGLPQSNPMVPPDVAAQMQKLIEKKGIRPQSLGSSSQASGTMSHEAGANPNPAANNQPNQALSTPAWSGTFSWAFPKLSGQVANEVQIHVLGFVTASATGDIRTDIWPKNLSLIPCKVPLTDYPVELQSWVKRHRPRAHLMQFRPNLRALDVSLNNQRFQTLNKFMAEQRIYVYAGWPLPSGKVSYNMVIFPRGPFFAGAVFADGLPELPGSGNTLDVQPMVEEAKPQTLSGFTLPLALRSRLQGLEPAQQRSVLAQLLRTQQQELRRQQPHTASSQSLNSLGISIPPNPYSTVANIPTGLQANVNGFMNSGAFNTGNGTVNYEMLQSFMQRSAEGSTSQGMSSGQMP